MILNETFDKYLEIATKVLLPLPPLDTGWFKGQHILPDKFNQYVQASDKCCGSVEIGGLFYGVQFRQPDNFKINNLSSSDILKAQIAYTLDGIDRYFGTRGFATYQNSSVKPCGEILEEFGFTKLYSYANPLHEYHQVFVWGCHLPKASYRLRKNTPEWLNGSGTNHAKNAEAEITLVSGTTEVNTASGVIGGLNQPAEVVLKPLPKVSRNTLKATPVTKSYHFP